MPSILARMHRQNRTFSIAPTLEEFEARQRFVMSKVSQLRAAGRIRVLSLHEVLCRTPTCAIIEGGRSLFSDDNHLTFTGTTKISPIFAEIYRSRSANEDTTGVSTDQGN